MRSQSGFSLVEMLVAVGIMGVIALGMASMIVDQSKQTKGLQQKLMAVELETSIKQAIQSDAYCGCLFRGLTLNTTTNVLSGAPDPIPSGYAQPVPLYPAPCTANATNIVSTAAPPSNDFLKASTITVRDIVQLGLTSYKANLVVSLDPANLVRSLKPVTASFSFNVDATNPAAAPILSCGASNATYTPTVVRSGFSDGFNSVSCPAGKVIASCHIEVNTGDAASNHYRNRIRYSPDPGVPTSCNMNINDGSDTYQLVAVCL